MKNITYNNRCR